MRLLNNKFTQNVFLFCGTIMLFGTMMFMIFNTAFPKKPVEEKRIEKFQHVWDERARYYQEHQPKQTKNTDS